MRTPLREDGETVSDSKLIFALFLAACAGSPQHAPVTELPQRPETASTTKASTIVYIEHFSDADWAVDTNWEHVLNLAEDGVNTRLADGSIDAETAASLHERVREFRRELGIQTDRRLGTPRPKGPPNK